MDKNNAFGQFLTGKFIEEFSPRFFRQNNMTPDEHDFAVFLGLSDQSYSQYKLGKRRPTIAVAEQLADKLKDPRVYDILGYPRRMPKDALSILFVDNVGYLTDDDRKVIKDIIQRRLEEKEQKNRPNKSNAFA